MRRTGLGRTVIAILALVIVTGCTGTPEDDHEPAPVPQSFGAIHGRTESGNTDYLSDGPHEHHSHPAGVG